MNVKKEASAKKKSINETAGLKTRTKKSSAKHAKQNNDMKTIPTKQSVSKFVDSIKNETRRKDAKKLIAMMKQVSGQKPIMWGPSIIGFGKYHYVYATGREGDMPLIGFSPRKANLVLYVMGALKDYKAYLDKLGKHKIGSSCLYINKLEDVDKDVLMKIIEASYKQTKLKWKA